MTAGWASRAADLIDPPELRWRRDPVAWVTERTRGELYAKQREILEAVRDHHRVAVKSCHSAGKSWTAAETVCWWLDSHPVGDARVVTTAPSTKQVEAVLWYEINRVHARAGLVGRTNLTEWYVGKEMVAFGRKPADYDPTAFQGVHARYLLVVLDEAYGIPKELWDAAESLASGEHSRILAIGNPDGPGEFQNVCKPTSGWHVIRISYRDTPNFTGEPVSPALAEVLIAPHWVESRRKRWGPDSALFQSKCEGEFPSGGDPFAVVQYDWARLCQLADLPEDPAVREGGIDVGAGGDRTIIRERVGPVAGRELVFIDRDPMRTVGLLAQAIEEWGLTRVRVDSGGIGWGIFGRLKELSRRHNYAGEGTHGAEVIPINFGSLPSPGLEKKYLNKRAELWWVVGRELSRLGTWDLRNVDDDTIHELTTPRYEILDSHGKVKIEPKKDIIERLGFSPDSAEALLLAFFKTHTQAKPLPRADSMSRNLVSRLHPNVPVLGGPGRR